MITANPTPPMTSISLLTAGKEIRFLKTLKQIQFSGQLVFTSAKEQQWVFHLYKGQIVYVTGAQYSVRRWHRNLAAHCPQMLAHRGSLQRELAGLNQGAVKICWEYHVLCLWIAQQKITLEQATKMIRAIATEVLFEVAQAQRVVYQIKEDNELSSPLVLIDVEEALAEFQKAWQVWRNAKVGDYSPNKAPVIKQPEELKKRTSAQIYQILSKLLDGQNTLGDLAVQMNQEVVQVTRSLMPYIQTGLVELMNIPDLTAPIINTTVPKKPLTIVAPTGPVIACVDDSPLVCHTMEALLTAAGYRFVGVEDALRAFAVLLARKPDVIFLDLVMPNTNGYEICAKLRKLPNFRNTPIVILTGNDGIVDRVRAKLVGASDFLSKPIDAGKVLNAIRKHLEQGAISN